MNVSFGYCCLYVIFFIQFSFPFFASLSFYISDFTVQILQIFIILLGKSSLCIHKSNFKSSTYCYKSSHSVCIFTFFCVWFALDLVFFWLGFQFVRTFLNCYSISHITFFAFFWSFQFFVIYNIFLFYPFFLHLHLQFVFQVFCDYNVRAFKYVRFAICHCFSSIAATPFHDYIVICVVHVHFTLLNNQHKRFVLFMFIFMFLFYFFWVFIIFIFVFMFLLVFLCLYCCSCSCFILLFLFWFYFYIVSFDVFFYGLCVVVYELINVIRLVYTCIFFMRVVLCSVNFAVYVLFYVILLFFYVQICVWLFSVYVSFFLFFINVLCCWCSF